MRLAYRAGWPDRQGAKRPRLLNRGWLRIGPWVIGNTAAWDRSEAP